MPPRSVPSTVADLIFYYYAKLVIAPSAGQAGNYRFIMDRYKQLKVGGIRMSDYDREIQKLAQQAGVCAFCGKRTATFPIDIIPQRFGGPVGIHNLVHACPSCAESKGETDLLRWWCHGLNKDKDSLPRIPAGLFLKLAYERHTVEFTLGSRCEDTTDLWPTGKTSP